MDIIGIIVSVILSIVMLIVSFYIFTIYCHPQDKGIGTSLGSKIIVILCQFLAWGQLLIIPLDISGNISVSESTSMPTIYSIVYIVIFVFTSFIVPFNIFLYQSDEDDSMMSRILWSILFATAICAVWSAWVFISYIWLSKYTFNDITYQISVPMYMMLSMGIVGWIFLMINGGVGLVYLPYDLIKSFFFRPKVISSESAFEEKKQLQAESEDLIAKGQELMKAEKDLKQSKDNWFIRKKKQSDLKGEVERYKKNVSKLQNRFEVFDIQIGGIKPVKNKKSKRQTQQDKEKEKQEFQANLKKKQTSPIIFCLSLTFGILAALVTIVWFVQILGTTINSGGKPLFLFLDPPLNNLQSNSSAGFLAVAIYSFLVLYLQGASVKGNMVFGLRIPFIISFHPMKKDRTYLNSFLFNVNMMMLCSIATTQLTVIAFPTYLASSYLGIFFFNEVSKLPMYGWLFKYKIFNAILLVIFLLSLISMGINIFREVRKQKKQAEKRL